MGSSLGYGNVIDNPVLVVGDRGICAFSVKTPAGVFIPGVKIIQIRRKGIEFLSKFFDITVVGGLQIFLGRSLDESFGFNFSERCRGIDGIDPFFRSILGQFVPGCLDRV